MAANSKLKKYLFPTVFNKILLNFIRRKISESETIKNSRTLDFEEIKNYRKVCFYEVSKYVAENCKNKLFLNFELAAI